MKTGSVRPEIKGWCPGALRPMMSGDGLVVRVRPRGGRLTQDQMRGIAALSARFGNGLIDLSARANLQMRGVAEASHGQLIDGLRALGLIDPSTEVEARRNLVVTPFWRAGDGTIELAGRLAEALAADDAPMTPGKFGYAVDCGPAPVLGETSADIRIERDTAGRLLVRADGATTGATVTMESAAAAALELAGWFLASGGAPQGRGRMAAHLARGVRLPGRFAEVAAASVPAHPQQPGPRPQGFLVGFEFGQVSAETVAALAEAGSVRLTPWRMVLIEGATDAPALPDLITTPDDPRLRVIACTGAPGCPQGLATTRPLARALARRIPRGQTLHVSGCGKGCAHPGPADLTLVARPDGRFDLIRNGTTADPPLRAGLDTASLIHSPDFLTE
ncbi:MAG: precorrin-3B synthase [Paracoccaceae bacterium]